MNMLWLFLIVPLSAYGGYVYSNWQWREVIRQINDRKPGPNPYR